MGKYAYSQTETEEVTYEDPVIPAIQAFKITSNPSAVVDYLECQRIDSDGNTYVLDGEESSTEVLVALPPLLRHISSRNGVNYTNNSFGYRTTQGTVINEYITPAYALGDIVYAFNNINGDVGVDGCDWLIISDSRMWCAVWDT